MYDEIEDALGIEISVSFAIVVFVVVISGEFLVILFDDRVVHNEDNEDDEIDSLFRELVVSSNSRQLFGDFSSSSISFTGL